MFWDSRKGVCPSPGPGIQTCSLHFWLRMESLPPHVACCLDVPLMFFTAKIDGFRKLHQDCWSHWSHEFWWRRRQIPQKGTVKSQLQLWINRCLVTCLAPNPGIPSLEVDPNLEVLAKLVTPSWLSFQLLHPSWAWAPWPPTWLRRRGGPGGLGYLTDGKSLLWRCFCW